ncbi:UNVERIFIED_CONTAM: Sec1 family domain-containing protein MIP3 [Sesamum calycinum]|uniref:Sec1 family domain-containing protein MIP3 n=1 Tax=Sesamum calycinum TaxID=2727403 RepID=A0AAW2Q3X2_9LAMI
MATVNVIKSCLDSVRQISENIKDAIVYLDAGSTESFQFLGAFPLFLELGAELFVAWRTCRPLIRLYQNPAKGGKSVRVGSSWQVTAYSLMCYNIIVYMSGLKLNIFCDIFPLNLYCNEELAEELGLGHASVTSEYEIYMVLLGVAHSAYPDSPLGPDAFHEYECLLNQDYEELVKKRETDVSGNSGLKESTASEDEGWSDLTSIEDDISRFNDIPSAKVPQEDYSIGSSEDAGEKLMVSVHHFPLILCPFSPTVFVLPSEGSVAEASLSVEHENSISSGLPPLSTGRIADTEDFSPGATLTAQFLYHLASKMDLKLEIFSLGDLSKNVGKLLTDMSSLYDVGRRKRSAGLLLIDRTLDLLTPCCHGDSLVDRMFSSLPRRKRITSLSQMKGSQSQQEKLPVKLERASLSVQIPLEKFITGENSKSNFQLLESIEAFLHGWSTLNSDAQNNELMKFSKKLNDEDVRIRPGFASKTELQSLVKALAKRQSSLIRNKGIIQLAAATLHALDDLYSASWDAFSSAEKILHVNAADTSQSLAAQISDLINKTALVASQVQKHNNVEKPGLFTLQDALLLTIIGYVLAGENFPTSGSAGPFSWQEEHFMKEAIVDAILENPAVLKLKFLHGFSEELESNLKKTKLDEKKEDPSDGVDFDDDQWGNWGDEDADKDTSKEEVYGDMQLKLELRDRVDNLFKFLHKLSSTKRNAALREGRLALESRSDDDPYSSKGLLYKLLTSILDKHDIPGLEYHSSTVGRLFKSGFGRFGLGQTKPSLTEQNVILIFVIGGISGVEVREVQEVLSGSSRPDVEVILGGTTFLTPDDMRELLLGDYCHM